jgi:hypothetical protein
MVQTYVWVILSVYLVTPRVPYREGTSGKQEPKPFLFIQFASFLKSIESDERVVFIESIHHQPVPRFVELRILADLLIYEFKCFESGFRIVAVIEKFLYLAGEGRINISLVKRV